jgi:hypothetical protein
MNAESFCGSSTRNEGGTYIGRIAIKNEKGKKGSFEQSLPKGNAP